MKRLPLGKTGPTVSALGLGCMGMSGMYGPADRQESFATLHAAVDAGITLLDTGDFYGMGHNESLIAEALGSIPRDRVLLSVKFGALRDPAGVWSGYDLRPKALGSLDVALTVEDMAAIELAVPKDAAVGERYPSAAMASLDSEN